MLNINILNDFPSVLNYRRMENMFRTDIGFIYRIDKHNIVLSLSANDIFKTYKSNYCYYSNSVRQEYVNYYDSRSVKFSVTWKFGDWNKKQISKKDYPIQKRKKDYKYEYYMKQIKPYKEESPSSTINNIT